MMSRRKIILHRFDNTIFLNSYLAFIQENFDTKEHVFLINSINRQSQEINTYPNNIGKFLYLCEPRVWYVCKYLLYIINRLKIMSKADVIVLHSLKTTDLFYYILSPSLIKKTVWVIWGYDLYDYRTRKSSFYSRLHFIVKKQIVKRILYVVARTPDYNLLQKWYKSKAELLLVEPLYTNGEFESSKLTIKNDTSTPIKITLGNSATKTNHHLEALDILSKYRNENLHLYIPLSYGDMEYAEIVKKRAKEIFGTKVTILDKFMGQDEYNKHLSQMDIGIFNIDRQQALGNISYLLATGTKIYLDSASPLWEIFDGFSFQVHSVSDILSEDFDAFTSLDIYELTYNSEHAKEIYSEKHSVECWNRVFNLAKGK